MKNDQICPLVKLLDRIRSFPGPGRPVVVFDLDSTLFCNSGRTLAVFLEYTNEEPTYAFQVNSIHVRSMKWSIDADLIEANIPDKALRGFTEFWLKRFFSDDMVGVDRPMPGAAAYVHKVLNAGGHVIYATGRDEPRMGQGTKQSLKKYGFPLDVENVTLIMKQDPEQLDVEFKKNVKRKIEESGAPIAFFEDHPGFANTFQKQFPDASVIMMNVPHPEDSPAPLPQIETIDNFLFPDQTLAQYMLVMTGLPATGKSTVAKVLAAGLGGEHISTDKIRADIFPSDIYDKDAKYSDEAKKKVYTLLYEKAGKALKKGKSVVMDGTFLRNTRDGLFEMAQKYGVQLIFVKTTCPEAEVKVRMNARATKSDFFSEAYQNVYQEMKNKLTAHKDRYLDIEKDPLITEMKLPLVVFNSGPNTMKFVNSKGHEILQEFLLVDFPLYHFPD